ncbi:FtsX-like permease family protein, partial [uncultured Jatrophihabitans sp.]|uniref:FtsX-like permease family protein n=1 Tax=uncultured Jatrophihabitans sp. TaxID=1610747 RepID=UPI0035CBDFB4
LASTVLLTDALAAAVLAAGGALAALAGAARRRRFEYAALGVAGASRRNLYAGLVIEQAAVLLFGAVAGVVAGVVAAALALRSLPEFVTVPASITLSYRLPAGTLVVFVVVAVLVLFALAAATSAGLLAGASPERLREIEE